MADEKTKRQSIAKRRFLSEAHPEGSRSASPETTALEFVFSNGEVRKWTMDSFSESIINAFAWHGMAAKGGDFFAGAKGVVGAALESFDAGAEVLLGEAGQWFVEKEPAGPRISDLVEAMAGIKSYTTDEQLAALATKLRAYSPDQRTALAERPDVAAAVAQIRANRAAKRAEELAEVAAKGETPTASAEFDDL